jgi:glucosamine--fructose-6-phosphate aminotransferase (isomerizing)
MTARVWRPLPACGRCPQRRLGRQYLFPMALEGALKLKEISYVHAEGYPAAEMKPGPIALVDEMTPSVFLAPHGAVYDKVMSNLQPLVVAIPLQLLAYHIALCRGCDIDKPRNLAKSVTVE